MSGKYALYDFMDHRGNNVIQIWIESLQKIQRQKINTRIAMLGANGNDLSPRVFSDTTKPHIKKIRVQGHIAVRLFFCRGPLDPKKEFTFLFGTTEKDNQTIDRNPAKKAEARQKLIMNNPKHRCIHEELCREIN